MNRIIVDEYETTLKDLKGFLTIQTPKCHIHLKGKNQIKKLNLPPKINLILELEEGATLENDTFNKINQEDIKITIISHHRTNLKWKMYLEVVKKLDLTFQNNMIGNYSKSSIEIHVVNKEQGKTKINSTGYIAKDTIENEFLEELKGLCIKEPSITFIPNLIVDSNYVKANHNATMKCIEEEELFYLKSKGLKTDEAIKLIQDGFLNKLEKKEVENES